MYTNPVGYISLRSGMYWTKTLYNSLLLFLLLVKVITYTPLCWISEKLNRDVIREPRTHHFNVWKNPKFDKPAVPSSASVIRSYLAHIQATERSERRFPSALWTHVKSELVAVCKHDIVACIPDFIPSLHCSANLISVTMEVQHEDRTHMVICMMWLRANIPHIALT